MDEKWKEQNQISDSTSTPNPQATNSSVPTPARPAPAVTPLSKTVSGEEVYDDYNNRTPASPVKKVVVFIAVLALLVIPGGTGAYFLFGRDKPETKQASETTTPQVEQSSSIEQKSIEVPADWKAVKTEIGLSVKTPDDWTSTAPITNSYNGLTSEGVSLGSPVAQDASQDYSVVLSVYSLENSSSQADFEKAYEDAFMAANTLPTSTENKDNPQTQANAIVSKLNINGREWTKFYTEAYGRFSATIYIWDNGRAIAFTPSSSEDSKESLEKSLNDYIYPMASSVETQ